MVIHFLNSILIKGLVEINNAESICELLVASDSSQDEIERASTAGIILSTKGNDGQVNALMRQ